MLSLQSFMTSIITLRSNLCEHSIANRTGLNALSETTTVHGTALIESQHRLILSDHKQNYCAYQENAGGSCLVDTL